MNYRSVLTATWIPVSLAALWAGLTTAEVVDPLFLPPPVRVVEAARLMVVNGELPQAVGETFRLMLPAFALGSLTGVLTGLAMGGSAFVRGSLDPIVSALLATPKLSLLPLMMLFLGIGAAPRIALIALSCFLVTALAALDAVRGISSRYVELARNYGATPYAVFARVLAPSALPAVFTGLRLAAGRGLAITIAIELVSAETGIGGLIWLAWQGFRTDRLFVGLFTAAALGVAQHWLLRRAEKKMLPWKSETA